MGRPSAPSPAASASNAAVPPQPAPTPTPTPTPPPAPVARYSDFGDEGDDELLLDDSAHAPTAADMGLTRAAPKSPAPTAKSAAAEPAKPAGATLFERMKHLSRLESNKSGSGSDDDDDPDGFPAMPKFLGRQSNQ